MIHQSNRKRIAHILIDRRIAQATTLSLSVNLQLQLLRQSLAPLVLPSSVCPALAALEDKTHAQNNAPTNTHARTAVLPTTAAAYALCLCSKFIRAILSLDSLPLTASPIPVFRHGGFRIERLREPPRCQGRAERAHETPAGFSGRCHRLAAMANHSSLFGCAKGHTRAFGGRVGVLRCDFLEVEGPLGDLVEEPRADVAADFTYPRGGLAILRISLNCIDLTQVAPFLYLREQGAARFIASRGPAGRGVFSLAKRRQ